MSIFLTHTVDYTNLSVDATQKDIEALCTEAIQFSFFSVCVRPAMVKHAHTLFPSVCSVVGFPSKKSSSLEEMMRQLFSTHEKVKETDQALARGASEIDMIIDLSSLKNKLYNIVEDDIRAVVQTAHPLPVKVIIETCFLSDEEKVIAAKLSECAGARFVKTSTGYGTSGAHLADIELLSRVVSPHIGIKASGGIQTLEYALKLFDAAQKYRKHPFRLGISKNLFKSLVM
jgi:deoxyribose-phosphate aldolase